MKRLMNFTALAALSTGLALAGSTASLAGEALDRVMSSGVLMVASDANWPPQSFLNEDNEMDGFDVDVAREIASRLGVTAEFVTPQWSVITAGHWNGRWDVSVGSMTPTASRREVLSFPGVYYYTPAAFAVHEDSPYQDKYDLDGKRIAVSQATVYEQYMNEDLVIEAEGAPSFVYDVKSDDLASYESSTTALDDLRLGDGVRIDGILSARPTFEAAIANGYPIRVVGTPAFYEPLSVSIDLGDQEFDDKLAGIIAAMHEDGALTAISVKWYGVDYSSLQTD